MPAGGSQKIDAHVRRSQGQARRLIVQRHRRVAEMRSADLVQQSLTALPVRSGRAAKLLPDSVGASRFPCGGSIGRGRLCFPAG